MNIFLRNTVKISNRFARMAYELALFGQMAKAFAIAFPLSCLVCVVVLLEDSWWWISSPWIYRHIDLCNFVLLISFLMPIFIAEAFFIIGFIWIVLRVSAWLGQRQRDAIDGHVHEIQ